MAARLSNSPFPRVVPGASRQGTSQSLRWVSNDHTKWEMFAVSLGPTELIIVLVIVMLLFGAAKLPKLARSLGESAKEFKQGIDAGGREDEKA
jgi:sec-independent protein translocase protein TatA